MSKIYFFGSVCVIYWMSFSVKIFTSFPLSFSPSSLRFPIKHWWWQWDKIFSSENCEKTFEGSNFIWKGLRYPRTLTRECVRVCKDRKRKRAHKFCMIVSNFPFFSLKLSSVVRGNLTVVGLFRSVNLILSNQRSTS